MAYQPTQQGAYQPVQYGAELRGVGIKVRAVPVFQNQHRGSRRGESMWNQVFLPCIWFTFVSLESELIPERVASLSTSSVWSREGLLLLAAASTPATRSSSSTVSPQPKP